MALVSDRCARLRYGGMAVVAMSGEQLSGNALRTNKGWVEWQLIG